MNKGQLITQIQRLNPTAATTFLEQFSPGDLAAYLRHLQEAAAGTMRISQRVAPRTAATKLKKAS